MSNYTSASPVDDSSMNILVLSLFALSSPPAEERCYLLLFGGKTDRNRPHTAHTWATFVRTTPAGLESFTISWLPVRMPVRPLKLVPEAGRNYGLHETLDLFNTGRQEVALWGPYEIRPDWYAEALAHKETLDSGAVSFLTLDRGPLLPNGPLRRPDISHCVHAVTRTNEALRRASNPVLGYGEFITRKLAERMNEVALLIRPECTHDWLIAALNLECYPLHRHRIGERALAVLRE